MILNLPVTWQSLPDETVLFILTKLDYVSLVKKKPVCRKWRELCSQAIDAKPTKVFYNGKQLHRAVKIYIRSSNELDVVNKFAETYGFPIGKWDVSNVRDFRYIFMGATTFNEDIRNWNLSNAENTEAMFFNAIMFNQDICRWDTSKVEDFTMMFCNAKSFNQKISNWDTSNAFDMTGMFLGAVNFRQDLSEWNVKRVYSIRHIFHNSNTFPHNLPGHENETLLSQERPIQSDMYCENTLDFFQERRQVFLGRGLLHGESTVNDPFLDGEEFISDEDSDEEDSH